VIALDIPWFLARGGSSRPDRPLADEESTMSEPNSDRAALPQPSPVPTDDALSEGGLRAPPGLSFWRKVWWWFDFLILVKIARLRFIGILLAIGIVIVKWDTLVSYYERWTRPAGAAAAASSDIEYYCPMHPSVIRDNPKDKCPICFMPLSKRKKGESTDEALLAGVVARVQLSPYRVVLGGIRTWKVDYVPLSKEITTVGYIEFNERELKHVAARVKGRLDELFVNQTGQLVHAGDYLASLYSPELLVTVQNLLDARRSGNADMLGNARERLNLLGISAEQIDDILKTGKANTHLKIRSPIDGHVIKKYVREGQYVDEGTPLYDIVDLSNVWVQAQVYEDDIGFLRDVHAPSRAAKPEDGIPVTALTRAFPSEPFQGKLTFVHPHVDQDTRTLTVRFELANPGHRLRPGMSATVKLRVPPKQLALFAKTLAEQWAMTSAVDTMAHVLGAPARAAPLAGIEPMLRDAGWQALLVRGLVLAVPESAIIDTGSQKIVYREESPGIYEGVKVELGPRLAGPEEVTFYPVLRGLEAGDRVVTAGSFLVDAETRLNPAAGSIYFGGTGLNKDSQSAATVRPSTPEDEEAKIKAVLGRMSAADRSLAMAQKFCPVNQDTLLGSMGPPVKVMIESQPVFLC